MTLMAERAKKTKDSLEIIVTSHEQCDGSVFLRIKTVLQEEFEEVCS